MATSTAEKNRTARSGEAGAYQKTADYLILGGGVVGVTVARELRRRHPNRSVVVLEKETAPALHASGRNSGVLHAGFYYTADSLKARFCRDGNRALREYCKAKGLRIHQCGKLVVARNEEDLPGIDELLRRGERNGVELEAIGVEEAKRIEPRVKTFERALFSPTTATVDPVEVMLSLIDDLREAGGEYRLDTRYLGRRGAVVRTNREEWSAGYLINAAGLHADRIARDHGFSQGTTILPFKGLYLYSDEPAGAFRTNIYPVPNLKHPFLGVHFTVTVDGKAKIGPTAVPALWREHYGGKSGFSAREFADITRMEAALFMRSAFDFRGLAAEEVRKYHRPYLVRQAAGLAEGVRVEDYTHWGRPGIRAQLLHVRERRLEMDFLMEGDASSFHILNAVSPAFTCSIPFASHVCDTIERTIG